MKRVASAPIDLRSIRLLRGTQHGGFEELCVSLFRHEMGNPHGLLRIDGAGGDGGVEAYFLEKPTSAIGLQAKFFEYLRAGQWSQIRDSIRRARKTHPSLTRYFVATPLNLNPHSEKIWKRLQQSAVRMRPSLELVWWGASELIDRLTHNAHAGRAAFWFGTPQFEAAWLDARNREAVAALDTRYTPKHHVRVLSQDVLAAFAREPAFVERYYEEARKLWRATRAAFEHPPPKEVAPLISTAFDAGKAACAEHLPRLGDGISLPLWTEALALQQNLQNAISEFSEATYAALEDLKKTPSPPHDPASGYSNPHDRLTFRQHEISEAEDALYEFRSFLGDFEAVDQRRLLIVGEAGSGKSHLLAQFVSDCRARGQWALFVLGEFFTSSADPWTQLVARLGWAGTADDLLAALNHAGETTQSPALLVIDALNETPDRAVWLNHLAAFAARLDPWPWVRLAVSCRSDFVRICLPSLIAEGREAGWSVARHRGFGDATFSAATQYFTAYRVQTRDLPPLLSEFQNPLFLKTFCEAFENSEVPPGPITLHVVMQKRVARAAALLESTIDCSSDTTVAAVETLAGLIAAGNWQPVPIGQARSAIDALAPGRTRSRSLFHHLCSSGLVTEVGYYDHRHQTSDVRVRFAYERFSDYFIALRLIATARKSARGRIIWHDPKLVASWETASGYLAHRGLIKALAIILPEKLDVEVADVVRGGEVRRLMLEDFLESLPWRSGASIRPRTQELLAEAERILQSHEVLRVLLRLSSVVDHPLNAKRLDRWLRSLPLWQRELEWTIPISEMLVERGDSSTPATYTRWLFCVDPKLFSVAQASLVARMLTWFFGSNDRGFRRRATLAAIRLLEGRCEVAAMLVDQYSEVDDPYLVERVLAVAAGVAVREKNPNALGPLARTVWLRVFALKSVKPHILTRDFAFTVLECARNLGCLPPGVKSIDYRPPYRSRWPKIWSNRKAREFGKPEGWHTIVHSIEPEYGNGIGGYGDFGRYTMEAHMHAWLNTRRTKPYPHKKQRKSFDSLVARAWILQRVAELGWTPERFAEYEKNLRHGRLRVDEEETKQERISKKYQWIALNELEGLASDHFHFGRSYSDEREKFEGAWQLSSRNFDPAQPLRDPTAKDDSSDRDAQRTREWWRRAADPFADRNLVRNFSAWVRTLPEDPSSVLIQPSVPELKGPALLLNGWFKWQEPEPFPPRAHLDGKCDQWIHVRSWLVLAKELPRRLRFLRQLHFWGTGVELPRFGSEGLGEYPWSERFRRLREACNDADRFGADFPPGFIHTVADYSEGDASASVPSPRLADLLGLRWTGTDYSFANQLGRVIALAPRKPPNASTPPCIVERESLLTMLARERLALIWGLVGERDCFNSVGGQSVADAISTFSGVYHLQPDGTIAGGLTVREITELHQQPTGHRAGASRRIREKLVPKKISATLTDHSQLSLL